MNEANTCRDCSAMARFGMPCFRHAFEELMGETIEEAIGQRNREIADLDRMWALPCRPQL